jgi:selenocysteine lyase/cysteine desulfurase
MSVPPLNPGLFHLDPFHLWVMHCSEGPVPRAVVKGVRDWLHKELWPWEVQWQEDALAIPVAVRQAAAAVIHAQPEDISLTPTTSSALVTLAQGYPWRAGDEVLAPLGEFPSNVYPWKALEARGVSFREVPLWEGQRAGARAWESTPPPSDEDFEARILKALGLRTRMVALSWVRFQDGLKLDLARLGKACAERGVHLVVDGIQGAGTAVPDLQHVSAFATGGHKGLLAPQGLGFLWTQPTFRSLLTPSGTWLSVEGGTEFTRASTDHDRLWVEDGRRLEPGVPNLMGCTGLRESLNVLLSPGIEAIASHVQQLQDHLLGALRTCPVWREEAYRLRDLLERDRLGSILSFHCGERSPEAMQELLNQGMNRGIFASVREGYLRIAFHGWHEEGDISRIAEWLRASGTTS